MSAIRTVLVFTLLGALLGAVVASLVVPPWLVWYNATGAIAGTKQVETLCNLPELIRYATHRLLVGQLVGATIGAVLAALLGGIVARRRSSGGTAVAG